MKKIEKMMKFVWNEFIYGGHLVALDASGIFCLTAIIFNQKFNIVFFILAYAMFQIIYSYNHYEEFEKDILTNPKRTQYLQKYKKYFLIIFGFYCIFFFLCLFYINSLIITLLSLFIISGGLLYTIFLKNLSKKIIGFKNFYVAFFWALLVILAGFFYNLDFNLFLLIVFYFVLLRAIINTTFFDIKDIESDKKEKLKTIPVIFGKNKTLNYLHIVNIFSFLPIIIGVYINILPLFCLGLLVFYFYSFYYLQKAKNENINIRNLSYIIVDGEFLFFPIVLFLSKFIFELW